MELKITYASDVTFTYDATKTESLFEQIKTYIHFSAVTYTLKKGTKLPTQQKIQEPSALKKYIDLSTKIELNCISDEVLKKSYYLMINAIEEESFGLEQNHNLLQKEIVSKWAADKNKYRLLTKEFNTDSHLFFDNPIQINISDTSRFVAIPRADFDAIGNKSLRDNVIYNLKLRSELLAEITSAVDGFLNIARSANEEIRPLRERNNELGSRIIFGYVEMLRVKKFIKGRNNLEHLSEILATLFNIDKRKFAQDKHDYKKADDKFHILRKIFNDLSKETNNKKN